MTFSTLGLGSELIQAISDVGYTSPTPIQKAAIPMVLMGRDVLGCAQTGTGKTASFVLPMIEILSSGRSKARMPRSLILEPTRELAAQVADNFEQYGKYHKLTKALLTGGSSVFDQIKDIEKGADVLIATPGRFIDVFDRGHLLMTDVQILVIDEADRMLDMGFIPDVEKIVSILSPMRTTLFFSATMPTEIREISSKFLSNPKEISVSSTSTPSDNIYQRLVRIDITVTSSAVRPQKQKRARLRELILGEQPKNALIFCNRKKDVDILWRSLNKHGFKTERLHGDMNQSTRTATLDKFKHGNIPFMVCSDVAARGLDIPEISHVFNYDVPSHPEDYVHRIGRTGRAGKKGRAFTLSTKEDHKYVVAIEKLIGYSLLSLEKSQLNSLNTGDLPDTAYISNDYPKKRSIKEQPRRCDLRDKKPSKTSKEGLGSASSKDSFSKNQSSEEKGLGDHVPAFFKVQI